MAAYAKNRLTAGAILFLALGVIILPVDGRPSNNKIIVGDDDDAATGNDLIDLGPRTGVLPVADDANSEGASSHLAPYYEPCGGRGGYNLCDRRTHYCDPVIDGCARCDDDCHPARIDGNRAATRECLENCALWYAMQSVSTTTRTTDIVDINPSNIVICGQQISMQAMMLVVTCACVVIALMLVVIFIILVRRTCCTGTNQPSGIRHRGSEKYPMCGCALKTASVSTVAADMARTNVAYEKSPVREADVVDDESHLPLLQPPSYDSSVGR